jgi:hypothetical protein
MSDTVCLTQAVTYFCEILRQKSINDGMMYDKGLMSDYYYRVDEIELLFNDCPTVVEQLHIICEVNCLFQTLLDAFACAGFIPDQIALDFQSIKIRDWDEMHSALDNLRAEPYFNLFRCMFRCLGIETDVSEGVLFDYFHKTLYES